jgi:hypothetical protein
VVGVNTIYLRSCSEWMDNRRDIHQPVDDSEARLMAKEPVWMMWYKLNATQFGTPGRISLHSSAQKGHMRAREFPFFATPNRNGSRILAECYQENRLIVDESILLVHPEGFEPTTLCSEDRCSNPLSYGCLCGQYYYTIVYTDQRALTNGEKE